MIISADDKQYEFTGNDPIILLFYVLNSSKKDIQISEKVVLRRHYTDQITTLYQILIGCIRVLYEGEASFSLGKYLKDIVEGKNELITSEFGFYLLNKMESIGIAQHFIWNPDIYSGKTQGSP